MKIVRLAMAAVVLGVVSGVGTAYYEMSLTPRQFEPHNQPVGSLQEGPESTGAPRALVVDGPSHDFGIGQRNSRMKHAFEIRNVGERPLELSQGSTTCKCTWSELEKTSLAPGESTRITLEWTVTTETDRFQQTAEIHTNAPRQATIMLEVHGEVADRVKLTPRDVVLSDISASEGGRVELSLAGYDTPELAVSGVAYDNQELAPYFDVEFSSAEVPANDAARTPAILLRGMLTIKPGLPLGPINQTIRIQTNVDAVPEVELPVSGRVVSDISVLGSGPSLYQAERNLLMLGTIDAQQGVETTLRVLVKGPHRHEVRLKVAEVEPADVLQVSLGEPRAINNGAVYMHSVAISIPPGARPVSRIGSEQGSSGRILIETTHPSAKSLPVFVRFAVQ